jgi:hypothetical protein
MDDSIDDWDSPSPSSSPDIKFEPKRFPSSSSSPNNSSKHNNNTKAKPAADKKKSFFNELDDMFSSSKDSYSATPSVNSSVNLSPAYKGHDSPGAVKTSADYLSNFAATSGDLEDSILGELLGDGGKGFKPLNLKGAAKEKPTTSSTQKLPKEPTLSPRSSSAKTSSRPHTKLEPLDSSFNSPDSNSEKASRTFSPNSSTSSGSRKKREISIRDPRASPRGSLGIIVSVLSACCRT